MPIEKTARVLIRPHVSEKSTKVLQVNQHTFRVAAGADKRAIKKAVETHYDVKVDDVRTVYVKGKRKGRIAGKSGRCKDWKKAYVTLAEGYNIIVSGGE
ncbi:MAG: 50S ribosomal protein L23 [Chromatiales bacterium]|nr:50S ribosomal protein L23 [Chromatiales bacterium]